MLSAEASLGPELRSSSHQPMIRWHFLLPPGSGRLSVDRRGGVLPQPAPSQWPALGSSGRQGRAGRQVAWVPTWSPPQGGRVTAPHRSRAAASVLSGSQEWDSVMCPFKEGCGRAPGSLLSPLSCLEGGQENEIRRLCYCTSRLFVLISDTHLLELLKMNYTSYRNRTFREFHSSCEH